VWVWNFVSQLRGRTSIEVAGKEDAEKKIYWKLRWKM
jgi:hypothetical protein